VAVTTRPPAPFTHAPRSLTEVVPPVGVTGLRWPCGIAGPGAVPGSG